VVAVADFFLHSIGLAVVIALGLAALGYFLFQTPVWCGAETRKEEWCRKNSYGLLRGCSIREHKCNGSSRPSLRPGGERFSGRVSLSAADKA
jgi:hypothetical protein